MGNIVITLRTYDESDTGMGILREYITIGNKIHYIDERFHNEKEVTELNPIEAISILCQEGINNIEANEKLAFMEMQRQIELIIKPEAA